MRYGLTLVGLLTLAACFQGGASHPAPRVLSVSPSDGSAEVERSPTVTVAFSAEMDCASLRSGGLTVSGLLGAAPGALVCAGALATFTPSSPLEPGAAYVVAIGTGARDGTGTAIADPVSTRFWVRPVRLAGLAPAGDGAVLTFTEAVTCATLGARFESQAGPVAGAWSCGPTGASASVTFTPEVALVPGTPLELVLAAGATTAEGWPIAAERRAFSAPVRLPTVEAIVVAFPPGSPHAAISRAEVRVYDAKTGWDDPGAAVVLGGVTLPWDAATLRYRAWRTFAPGEALSLAVTTAGGSGTAQVSLPDPFPVITSPRPGDRWTTGCDLPVTFSAMAAAEHTLGTLELRDAADPIGGLRFAQWDNGALTDWSVAAWALAPGDRLVLRGHGLRLPIPAFEAGSFLRAEGYDAVPVRITADEFIDLALEPGDAGVATGAAINFTATGRRCGTTTDVTARAAFSTSDPQIATASDAAGPAGQVTGLRAGRVSVTATLDGLTASAPLVVRDWTLRAKVTGAWFTGAAWRPDGWYLSGKGLLGVLSPDLATWNLVPAPLGWLPAGALALAAGDPGQLLFQPGTGILYERMVPVGGLGAYWTTRALPSGTKLRAAAWDGATFAAVGDGGFVATSPDAESWTEEAPASSGDLLALAASPTAWVAAGGGPVSPALLSSSSPASWVSRAVPGGSTRLAAVTWTGDRFVAAGDGGVSTSPDGVEWSAAGPEGRLVGLAGENAELIGVTAAGGLLVSTDGGATWVLFTAGGTTFTAVAAHGGSLLAVGSDGSIYSSP